MIIKCFALHLISIAAWYESYPLVDYLIEHKANLNLTNSRQQTPLHWACMSGDLRSVASMVNGGANIEVQVSCLHQFNPIQQTVLFGHHHRLYHHHHHHHHHYHHHHHPSS